MKRLIGPIVVSALTSAAVTALGCFLFFQTTLRQSQHQPQMVQDQRSLPSDVQVASVEPEASVVAPVVSDDRATASHVMAASDADAAQADALLAQRVTSPRMRLPRGMLALSDAVLGAIYAGGPGADGETASTGAAPASETERIQQVSQERRTAQSALEVALQERGGLLMRKGKWQVEPSFSYTFIASSTLDVVGLSVTGAPELILLAITQTEKIRRDILSSTLTIRHGVLNNLQAEVRIPHRYQHERRTFTGQATDRSLTASGLSDIEVGLSHQVLSEGAGMPGAIVSVGVKTDTGDFRSGNDEIALGSGSNSYRGAILFVKTDDPIVLFGKLGYTYNAEADHGGAIGTLKPGDTVEGAIGLSMAMSYRTAVSFSASESYSFKSLQNDRGLGNSQLNVASLRMGMTYSLSDKTSIDVGVSTGLTDDAPDFSVDFRFPHTF